MKYGRAAPLALGVGLLARAAIAEVSLKTEAPAKVEVGQRFTVQVTALGAGAEDAPSQPKLHVPPGFSVSGPSISTNYQVTTVNGRFEQHQGLTASWILMPSSVGRFRIGPGSVVSGGHQVTDRPISVEVVAPGKLPAQRGRQGQRNPLNPFDFDFDPFSSPMLPPMRGLQRFGNPEPEQQLSAWPREFDIAQPRDPVAFLDSRATPKKVVIGQQVTFSIFAYGHAGPLNLGAPTEPSLSDFLAYDLMEDGSSRETPMRIGEDIWFAQKLRERALFPLHSGRLVIGPMRVRFQGADPNGQAAYKGAYRQSQPMTIVVVEPPLAGRPSGYRLGDVGQFKLTATVEPREVTADDAVAVTFELAGTGNLPQRIDLPERKGAEWLEPSTNETIEHKNGKMGGRRSWQYVLKLHEAGVVDLGKVTLPYYDPERGQYALATAELGQILVRAGAAPAPPVKSPNDSSLAQSLTPRDQLSPVPEPRKYWADAKYFWLLVLLGPFSIAATMGLKSLGTRLSGFWSQRRDSVTRRTLEQLATARDGLSRDDVAGAASAVERALYMAVEASTGLRARGIVRSELTRELTRAGMSPEHAEVAVQVFDACDTARFTKGASVQLTEVLERADSLVQELCRLAASKPRRAP